MNVENTEAKTAFNETTPTLFGLGEGEKAIVIFGLALFEGERCPEEAHLEFGLFLTTEDQIHKTVKEEKAKEECLKVLKEYGVVNFTTTMRMDYMGYGALMDELSQKGYKIMTCGNRIKVKFEEFYGPSIADMLFTSCRLSPMFEHSKMRNEIEEIYDITKRMNSFPYNYAMVHQLDKITVISENFVNEFTAVIKAYEIFSRMD
ncbi:MAG: hypothetical protein E7256_11465 [Lachnospiraceae bacterium]|nr:hypothetical protein [Lachnospiraceae bacterium]